MSDKVSELMQIGSRLSVCRQNKNMTQEELAYKLGITPQALSKWERGVSFPDISMLADISRLLEVSTDYLLGIGMLGQEEDSERTMQVEIGNNLRNYATPSLELIFGEELVPLFRNDTFREETAKIRKRLSYRGIWLPIMWFRDDLGLEKREYMIMASRNVLYSEVLETVDEESLKRMLWKLEQMVREKYYEVLNPDIMKCLVDNLRIRYPALLEGIIPEKISYGLLTEVAKRILARENSTHNLPLPKIIEVMECALYHTPEMSVEELVERVAAEVEREDSFWVIMRKRGL